MTILTNKLNNRSINASKWMQKGKKYVVPDGTKIKFIGANPKHLQILFIIPRYPIHISFVIRPEDIELHLTHEPNHKHKQSVHESILSIKNEKIKQRVEDLRKQNGVVKSHRPQQWLQQYHYRVIDIDIHELTFYQSSPFSIDLKFLKQKKLSKRDILKIRFTFGYAFDTAGNCKGLLCGDKENNQVIFIKAVFLRQIIGEFVNLHTLAPEIRVKIEEFGRKLFADDMWNDQVPVRSRHDLHSITLELPWAYQQYPRRPS